MWLENAYQELTSGNNLQALNIMIFSMIHGLPRNIVESLIFVADLFMWLFDGQQTLSVSMSVNIFFKVLLMCVIYFGNDESKCPRTCIFVGNHEILRPRK